MRFKIFISSVQSEFAEERQTKNNSRKINI